MEQMLQRLVDVESGDELFGVLSRVDDEFREPHLKGFWENDEEKRQIVFLIAEVRFGEFAEPKAVIGEED